jgi:hypothetical protein
MPVRVELIDEAIEGLARYQRTDIFPRLLAKLVRLEEVGMEAGIPLGRSLVGARSWSAIATGASSLR